MSQEQKKYQQAMARLETILEEIDDSSVGIDELADRVQEAAELLKQCRGILTQTERRVQNSLEFLEGELDAEKEQEKL